MDIKLEVKKPLTKRLVEAGFEVGEIYAIVAALMSTKTHESFDLHYGTFACEEVDKLINSMKE